MCVPSYCMSLHDEHVMMPSRRVATSALRSLRLQTFHVLQRVCWTVPCVNLHRFPSQVLWLVRMLNRKVIHLNKSARPRWSSRPADSFHCRNTSHARAKLPPTQQSRAQRAMSWRKYRKMVCRTLHFDTKTVKGRRQKIRELVISWWRAWEVRWHMMNFWYRRSSWYDVNRTTPPFLTFVSSLEATQITSTISRITTPKLSFCDLLNIIRREFNLIKKFYFLHSKLAVDLHNDNTWFGNLRTRYGGMWMRKFTMENFQHKVNCRYCFVANSADSLARVSIVSQFTILWRNLQNLSAMKIFSQSSADCMRDNDADDEK